MTISVISLITPCVAIIILINTCYVQKTCSCDKSIFHKITRKRGEGQVLINVNDTSYCQCLRMCRLAMKCYRFNFDGTDTEIGRCQLLIEYTGLTDDVGWSYYVSCPEGMDYYQSTGSCYGLTNRKNDFDAGTKNCEAWASGVHIAAIYSEVENDICTNYWGLTDNRGMFIGARRTEENNNYTDEFYWITTGASMTFTRWNLGYPKSNTNKQCILVIISD
ncbi:hypothetical protein LSH36_119g03050, partial [Paralvinella palmiformis]